jgi:hypothetical protein
MKKETKQVIGEGLVIEKKKEPPQTELEDAKKESANVYKDYIGMKHVRNKIIGGRRLGAMRHVLPVTRACACSLWAYILVAQSLAR